MLSVQLVTSGSTPMNPEVDTAAGALEIDDVANPGLKPPRKRTWRKPFVRSIRSNRSKSASDTTSPDSFRLNILSDGTTTESGTTLETSSLLPSSRQGAGVMSEAYRQRQVSKTVQERVSLSVKAKWSLGGRKRFLKHLDNLHASNDVIRDLLSMRALTGIYKVMIEQKSSGVMPNDILAVNSSLLRLHRTMVSSNKRSEANKRLSVSLKILKAADYVIMRKRIPLRHDYVEFRDDSAVFPLQIGPPYRVPHTMILAETTSRALTAVDIGPDTDKSLSEMLQPQTPEADESLKMIGSIAAPESLLDVHRLFQDINVSWTVNGTVEVMIKNNKRHMTYVSLAVQLAFSYMYIVSFKGQDFPGLADYQYYEPHLEQAKSLEPDEILEPYLGLGFGSKPQKQSTADIGGLTSRNLLEDEALARLGLILHQVGCWKLLEDRNLATARGIARMRRNELIDSAGMPFTRVVDFCLGSKLEDSKPEAQAERVYKNVVVPLQRIVEDLKFD